MSFLATPSPSAHPLLLATYKKTSRRKLRPDVEQETNEFVFTTIRGSSAAVIQMSSWKKDIVNNQAPR